MNYSKNNDVPQYLKVWYEAGLLSRKEYWAKAKRAIGELNAKKIVDEKDREELLRRRKEFLGV